MIGQTLNQYRITAAIGAGGMGEVFRARDTRLNRDVAVKVLPKDFVADADRMRRFEQEAKTLAALNHPNILTIHDAGVQEGAPYLVSELLEGRTLREEMSGGALSVRKATEFALQIAQGLAAAHGKGVVHRDLKPENIFVTKDGRVKILDFGLAKLRQVGTRSTASPTEKIRDGVESVPTIRIDFDAVINTTEPGMVLGTPAYMAPEQVRGEPADHRADIFAFGCVLYEMLSGTRAFRRDTPVESMNAVLNDTPPELVTTNPNTPSALERIVHRCLEKQPERRFHSAHDLAFAIESVGIGSTSTQAAQTAEPAHPLRKRFLPWAVAVIAILVALSPLLTGRRAGSVANHGSTVAPVPLRKLEIRIPLPKKDAPPRLTGLAISPDGRTLAYANADGLWLRPLDRLGQPALIWAADKVSSPFWSPRSTDVAWFEDASLKRAAITGGRPVTICRLTTEVGLRPLYGGAWFESGEIIFATGFGGLFRVPAQGGSAELALPLAEGEQDFHQASALPDGRSVVFVIHRIGPGGNPIDTLDTLGVWNPKDGRKVLYQRAGSDFAHPVFSSSGHIIFTDRVAEADEQWALPISLNTLEPAGQPIRLSEGGLLPSVSADGTLVLARQEAGGDAFLAPRQLVWVDRSGKIGSAFGPVLKGVGNLRLSPDERSVAFSSEDNLGASRTWILDLAGGSALPLRPEGLSERNPFWLPSGREIAVTSFRTNGIASRIRAVEGNRASETIGQGVLQHLSRSGQYAFLRGGGRAAGSNFYVRLASDRTQPMPLPSGSPNLLEQRRLRPNLSPDDATLAFQSDESDRREIWAVAFPGFTNRVLVSRGGGIGPLWSRDGKELFYFREDGLAMMAAPVVNQNGRQFGAPVKLFDLPHLIFAGEYAARFTSLFDVSADGQRFLMMHNVPDPNVPAPDNQPRVLLIQNWFEEFREKQ